jgi:hypothetical protein
MEVPVVLHKHLLVWLVGGCVLAACGGDDAAPAAGTPAVEPPAPTTEATDAAAAAAQAGSTELVREAFAYSGAGRDPFLSLLRSGDVRPLPRDLRVRAINYDARYPQRSVAVIQDTTANKRYSLHVGDQVGRLRIVQIRPTEVVVTIEEFGVERQIVLPIRRRQEDIP